MGKIAEFRQGDVNIRELKDFLKDTSCSIKTIDAENGKKIAIYGGDRCKAVLKKEGLI